MNFNSFKTIILMIAIVALFGAVGALLGGQQGMIMALLFGGAMNLFAWWNSDKMVLRMYNAQQVDEQTSPEFYRLVADLAQRAQLPMPRVYIIQEDQPNAFATGRNPQHAAVAATTGIMRILSERELRGVMAHELAHVAHRDTLISTIAASVAGAITALAQFAMFFGARDSEGRSNPIAAIAVMLLAPLAAGLIQMAISRSREFEADRGGAEFSGDPLALASALKKIEYYAQNIHMQAAETHPETAQMMIINPLAGGHGVRDLFRTHPRTEERIARLEAIARGIM